MTVSWEAAQTPVKIPARARKPRWARGSTSDMAMRPAPTPIWVNTIQPRRRPSEPAIGARRRSTTAP